ncbi:hypothetical protein T484DRAFT_3632002 [Baffinella frigidus]|nr:hypothetical protein T484DRAFT_3632002 [Cryptophyta sp. CCMP2293]
MAMFVKDMSYLGPLQGVSTGPRDRFARVLAIVHAPVPCKEELVGSKSTAVPCTIIRPLGEGFSVAPYAMAKKGQTAPPPKDGEKPEPLFRMDNTTSPPGIDVWSYISKGMNRGPRQGAPKDETTDSTPPMYNLSAGMTFVTFVNALTFQSAAATTVLPTDRDWIPAMSIVELTIAPRHSESCLAGRGINVKSMRISSMEMDAVFQNGIETMGMSYNAIDASRLATERRERYPAMLKDIETEKVSFVVPSDTLKTAYMGELPTPVDTNADSKPIDSEGGNGDMFAEMPVFVKICVGSGHPAFPASNFVDVPITCLQKQTNTRCDKHACAMLDVALALSAVDLFCITDDRFASRGTGSSYRAIPVIDTKKMFACIARVRTVNADHAMVAVFSNGVAQMDESGAEVLERIELADVGGDDSDDDGVEHNGMLLTLSTGVDYDDGVLELSVNVNEEDVTKTHPLSKCDQSNMGLAIVGPGVKTTKGYSFSFSVKCAADESRNVIGILNGFINRAAAAGSISRKRKSVKMQ